MAGGVSGPVVIPGNPEGSRLWMLVREGKMPLGGKLSDGEKQLIRDWIETGQFPSAEQARGQRRSETISEKARQWWSFRTPVKPPVPTVRNTARVRNPIDAFVLQKLEEKRWTLGPEADKRTLVRRAYFDLLGLPPAPEQVNEFLADTRPGAWSRLIDRLLESPHYGEHWGRHWLDVAGYSDSIGNSTDEVRTLAWRYRDWVIRALNEDKPYNEFLVEQFAGDQLVNYNYDAKPRAEDMDKLTATGFLRVAPDYGDQQPIYQVDKYYDALQATTETALKATIGIQLACARCHDHKFDPILQEDYYKLTAAFQPALDPEKWIPATAFSYGTWPARHMLNIDLDMATTFGLVQNLQISPSSFFACVWVGPTPANAELFVVQREDSDGPVQDAYRTSMVDALTMAMMAHLEVGVDHDDNNSRIQLVTLKNV
jgi:hypothetical protein